MNFNNFTTKSQEAVQQAIDLAQAKSQQIIEPAHLLMGVMMKGEDVVQFLFGKTGIQPSVIQSAVEQIIAGYPRVSGGEPYFSRETNEVLQKAIDYSSRAGDQFVTLEYILFALLHVNSQVSKLLKDAGATEKDLQTAINELRKGAKASSSSAEEP